MNKSLSGLSPQDNNVYPSIPVNPMVGCFLESTLTLMHERRGGGKDFNISKLMTLYSVYMFWMKLMKFTIYL